MWNNEKETKIQTIIKEMKKKEYRKIY